MYTHIYCICFVILKNVLAIKTRLLMILENATFGSYFILCKTATSPCGTYLSVLVSQCALLLPPPFLLPLLCLLRAPHVQATSSCIHIGADLQQYTHAPLTQTRVLAHTR